MVDFVALTSFMAAGKDIKRGTIIKGKEAAKWTNISLLEAAKYVKRVEPLE